MAYILFFVGSRFRDISIIPIINNPRFLGKKEITGAAKNIVKIMFAIPVLRTLFAAACNILSFSECSNCKRETDIDWHVYRSGLLFSRKKTIKEEGRKRTLTSSFASFYSFPGLITPSKYIPL